MEQITKKQFNETRDTTCLFKSIPTEIVELILTIRGYDLQTMLVCKEWNTILMEYIESHRKQIWESLKPLSVFLTYFNHNSHIMFGNCLSLGCVADIHVAKKIVFLFKSDEIDARLSSKKSTTYSELAVLFDYLIENSMDRICKLLPNRGNIFFFDIMKKTGCYPQEICKVTYGHIKHFVERGLCKEITTRDIIALKACSEKYNESLTFEMVLL